LYDSWTLSFYNILFTGLPIFMVAAFDQPISRKQIMDYPPLYLNGIRHQSVHQSHAPPKDDDRFDSGMCVRSSLLSSIGNGRRGR
jgi:hypothetical protein